MATQRWIAACALVALSAGAALLPMTALATPPTREIVPFDFSFVAAPATAANPCPFAITVEQAGTAYITGFSDRNGNPIRELDRAPQMVVTLTGPTGTSLQGSSVAPQHATFTDTGVILDFTGSQLNIHVPGGGRLFAVAGHEVITIDFSTTPPTVTDTFNGLQFSDTATLCGMLNS